MSKHRGALLLGGMLGRIRTWNSFLWRWEAQIKGVEFEGSALFVGRPLISVAPGAKMVIGDDATIISARRATSLACAQPSVLRAMLPGARLIVGRGVGMSATVLCAGSSIEIGERTIFGSGAMVLDNDFHKATADGGWDTDFAANARPVRIGAGVFVGARAIVLKGVTIGDRAMIGAGAVVTKDVPPGAVAGGNPARILTPGTAPPLHQT